MFVHTSAFKAQAGIGVIQEKIMTQQHLMEEVLLILDEYKKYELEFLLQ